MHVRHELVVDGLLDLRVAHVDGVTKLGLHLLVARVQVVALLEEVRGDVEEVLQHLLDVAGILEGLHLRTPLSAEGHDVCANARGVGGWSESCCCWRQRACHVRLTYEQDLRGPALSFAKLL